MHQGFLDSEREVLAVLDRAVNDAQLGRSVEPIVRRVQAALTANVTVNEAWEPIPLELYRDPLPAGIKSSWVFVLRANLASGAERHPNSHQRVTSYRGHGDFQVHDGEWKSHFLVSDAAAPLERKWVSIPPYTWHQAVVPASDWVVLSFHTVRAEELIEERPASTDLGLTRQRRYLDAAPALSIHEE
jgi:hypothetical protein